MYKFNRTFFFKNGFTRVDLRDYPDIKLVGIRERITLIRIDNIILSNSNCAVIYIL
jgi:hypothetical protein